MGWGAFFGGACLLAGAFYFVWRVAACLIDGVAPLQLSSVLDMLLYLIFDVRMSSRGTSAAHAIRFSQEKAPIGFWLVVAVNAALAAALALLAYWVFNGSPP